MKDAGVTNVGYGLILLAILGQAASTASIAPDLNDRPIIHVEDVAAFYKLYAATDGRPTAKQLQHDYLDPGSAGIHRMAQLRNVTGASIAAAMAKYPDMYADAQRCMVVLPDGQRRVAIALHKLGQVYPEAQFPPVTISIGRA